MKFTTLFSCVLVVDRASHINVTINVVITFTRILRDKVWKETLKRVFKNDLDLCDSYIWNKYIMYIMTLYSNIENLADIKIFVSVNMDTLNTRY